MYRDVTRVGRESSLLATRRFALNRSEILTTGIAAVVSTGGYLAGGQPYLARGVLGDLIGFAALASVAARTDQRPRHEAAICLAAIGAVLLAHPRWPLRLRAATWWALFAGGLMSYLAVRRRACD